MTINIRRDRPPPRPPGLKPISRRARPRHPSPASFFDRSLGVRVGGAGEAGPSQHIEYGEISYGMAFFELKQMILA